MAPPKAVQPDWENWGVQTRGHRGPEIVGLKETLATGATECIGLFAAGLEKYYARDWDGAMALFRQSEQLEPNRPGITPGVKTNPSLVYLGIAAHYRVQPPPPEWDGVYTMTEK